MFVFLISQGRFYKSRNIIFDEIFVPSALLDQLNSLYSTLEIDDCNNQLSQIKNLLYNDFLILANHKFISEVDFYITEKFQYGTRNHYN